MNDIEDLKKLAGITEFQGYTEYTLETASQQASENKLQEKENNIRPGDPEWFDLWFGNKHETQNFVPGFRGRNR